MTGTTSSQTCGGRFIDRPGSLNETVNFYIALDKRFATQNIADSRAHASVRGRHGHFH